MTELICPDCRHENEPERIYCHNCGGRLDRSAVKKEKLGIEERPEHTQERLKKLFDPARGRRSALLTKIGKVVGGAFCLALVIQLLLPPVLPPLPRTQSFAPMINMDLLSAVESHNPSQLSYSQDQVNSYLISSIRRSNSPARHGFFPIEKVFVQFEEGTCRIHVAHNFFGFTLYDSACYHVKIEQGKLEARSCGGQIGRMPIHPALMSQLDFLFNKTWATFERERKQVAQLAGIEFHPQGVTMFIAR